MSAKTSIALTAVAGFALVVGIGPRPNGLTFHGLAIGASGAAPIEDIDRYDCPGPYFRIRVPDRKGGLTLTGKTTTRVGGKKSQIAEFNDCQRFINSTGEYEALYAVFASETLDSLDERVTNKDSIWAAAEVYSVAGHYPALGIRKTFSCLYMSSNGNFWEAHMLQAGDNEDKCSPSIPFGKFADMTHLSVRRVQVKGLMADSDYPAVARWEGRGDHYIILLKCGNAYCEIGVDEEFAGTKVLDPHYPTLPLEQRRVREIKLWSDEQVLAIPKTAATGSNRTGAYITVRPTTVVATVTPAPDLAAKDTLSFKNQWVLVATIHLSDNIEKYQTRFGLMKGNNALYLMRRPGKAKWDAHVVHQSGAWKMLPSTVLRHGHEAIHYDPPGTVRWRWMANDETVWSRCAEGCCQILEI